MKLQKEREELAAREQREMMEQQRKVEEAKRKNEQIMNSSIVHTKKERNFHNSNDTRKIRHDFMTPQTRSSKVTFLDDGEYQHIEKTLVGNAHNDLRNEFTISMQRIKQEFDMTNDQMAKQIELLKKATDKEKEEKKYLHPHL